MQNTLSSQIHKRLTSLLNRTALPQYDDFISLCLEATSILEKEISDYRPSTSAGSLGGLLDFSSTQMKNLPAVIVPDIHGRLEFLIHALDFCPPFSDGRTVLDLLCEEKIVLLCLGDLPHAEGREQERWTKSYRDFCDFLEKDDIDVFLKSDSMKSEMIENLSVWEAVFVLKTAFPNFFHVLKGNHENVQNATFFDGVNLDFGNRAFKKFCEEGEMCAQFIKNQYDDLFLYYLSNFERSLPICAVFKTLVASHAEPLHAFSREELVDALSSDDAIYSLTWTANGEAAENSIERTIAKLYKRGILGRNWRNVRWIGGHRPVQKNYALRQNGFFVQIHNPQKEQIAVVLSDRVFNPETDIFLLKK